MWYDISSFENKCYKGQLATLSEISLSVSSAAVAERRTLPLWSGRKEGRKLEAVLLPAAEASKQCVLRRTFEAANIALSGTARERTRGQEQRARVRS
jgi:hypothetical protein